jgi:AcrR family transcriptional regulator
VTRRSAQLRLDDLLRTAIQVIVDQGLSNTRTADVAKAAGVSQALVFYHFSTKEALITQAFAYAAEQDLAKLEAVVASRQTPLEKLRRLVRLLAPQGRSDSWLVWIDGWSEALRNPELEKVSRRLDLRWKEALIEVITAGVASGEFTCDDPQGAAWRINCLIDGLAVQLMVHDKVISRRQAAEWMRLATAREVGLDPQVLS